MNYLINTNAKQITMLDGRFYHTDKGEFVPSVTTILEAYPKDASYYMWLKQVGQDADTIRDEAGRRGTTVHEMTEAYDRGAEVSLLNAEGHLSFKVSEWAMFERYVEFSNRFKPEILLNEQNFVDAALGYAGTVDRVILLNGTVYLMDIKTSNVIYPSYWLQMAAYKQLLIKNGHRCDAVAILHLNAKTRTEGKKGDIQGPGWQMVTKDDSSEDLELFMATRRLWLAQNKEIKPRQATYKLSHSKEQYNYDLFNSAK